MISPAVKFKILVAGITISIVGSEGIMETVVGAADGGNIATWISCVEALGPIRKGIAETGVTRWPSHSTVKSAFFFVRGGSGGVSSQVLKRLINWPDLGETAEQQW